MAVFIGPELVCQTARMPRPWQVYEFQTRTAKDESGNEFTYFVEMGNSKEMDPIGMPTEVFNRELQSFDTTSVEQVEGFTIEYGFMPSAVYDGKARLNLYRKRFKPWSSWRPLITRDDLGPHVNEAIVSSIAGGPMELSNRIPERAQNLLTPALQSEAARRIEAKNREVRGVISVAEMAQSIRLLQVACTLPAVVQVASDNKWEIKQVAEYLSDKKYLQQAGESYFLESADPIFCNHRISSYDAMMEYDDFAAMVGRSEVEQPRVIYDYILEDKLRLNAQRALNFLSASVASYAKTAEVMPRGDNLASFVDAIRLRSLGKTDDKHAQGSPAEAIIWQFTSEFNNQTPFRTCKNCGRVFKKYREERYKANGHIRETAFCRKSCGVVYAQRRAREE